MTSTQNRARRYGAKRRAFTLVEVMTASIITAVLTIGMASTIMFAMEAADDSDNPQIAALQAGEVLHRILRDLEEAVTVTQRDAVSIEFFVPDRTGDAVMDRIRYDWGGTPGDPLTYKINGGSAVVLAADVHKLDFRYLIWTLPATP
ncbi:MAG: prepilin-type N-terminal cleavage/methylation domain-containing protein [Phycisphaerae bacterium]